MASFQKQSTGWRAQIQKAGIRKSKVFPTKREAQDWASRQEYLITNERRVASKQTLAKLFDRYAREVSPTKRGIIGKLRALRSSARTGLAR